MMTSQNELLGLDLDLLAGVTGGHKKNGEKKHGKHHSGCKDGDGGGGGGKEDKGSNLLSGMDPLANGGSGNKKNKLTGADTSATTSTTDPTVGTTATQM